MDVIQSPLKQQSRPEVFEVKIVGLYKQLFSRDHQEDDDDLSDAFWDELFLLKPELGQLRRIIKDVDAPELLQIESQPRLLLLNAIDAIKASEGPSDENALDTLTAFFAEILAKKYTNPSSDIIEVLTGLDNVDSVFADLVGTLEQVLRTGRNVTIKQKAARTAVAVVAGGYQTALVSYFIHRDYFPSLMKLIAAHDNPIEAAIPFLLIGLLANYDKFESASNSYRIRFGDFVHDTTMSQISACIGWTSILLRELYTAVLDDTPVSWSIGGTLSYVGLGGIAGVKPAVPVLSEQAQKLGFGTQPGPQAAMLLPLYDFILSNKLFADNLVAAPALEKDQPTPFAAILSFISYLMQHAYRSTRAGWYAYLSSLILLVLVTDERTSRGVIGLGAPVRISRQRPPYLPAFTPDRPYVAAFLDIAMDAINHNLRKKLDTALYAQLLDVLATCLRQLAKTQSKLNYHWPELWRSLLAFMRFMISYPEEIKAQVNAYAVTSGLVNVLSLSLRLGESIVPNDKDYDDLVYKLVESGDTLMQFRDAYELDEKSGIGQLIEVSTHYRTLIEEKHGGRVAHLSPREVSKVIKQGYETLQIEANEQLSLEHSTFREADHKSSLKRLLRVVLVDAQMLVSSDGIAVPSVVS